MKLPSKERLAQIRADFQPGTRVILEYMDDAAFAPPVGTLGTVLAVDSLGDLIMCWDNGSGLNVCLEVDRVRKEDDRVG